MTKKTLFSIKFKIGIFSLFAFFSILVSPIYGMEDTLDLKHINKAGHYVLAFDIEASGSSLTQNGIVSVGSSLQDENSNELKSFQVNLALPENRSYEESCLKNFWLKNLEAYEFVSKNALPPKEAMTQFYNYLESIEKEYPELIIISDNPTFDIAWLNLYLAEYTDRLPLNYSAKKEYRMIWDSSAVQKTLLSIKTGDFTSKHGHIKKLGFESKWVHNHNPLNDARRIADFYNQAMKELKKIANLKTGSENIEIISIVPVNPVKTIEVTPYNPQWPNYFKVEEELIKKALEENCVEIHHIGSTAVPELSAKPIIDIIAVLKDISSILQPLEKIGYKYKGDFNLPFRPFFGKKESPFEINLHIHEEGNPEIELNLLFRDFLRNSPQARSEYANLKMNLLSKKSSHEKESSGFTGYNLGKDKFIRTILNQTTFSGICPRFCTHYDEWETYHSIRQQALQMSTTLYDKNHTMFKMKNHYHFVLYKGTGIVAVAHVEALNPSIAALRMLVTDKSVRKSGYGTHMMKFLEKWVKRQGYTVMKMHSDLNSQVFFKHLGYENMPFYDPLLSLETNGIGKYL